MSDDTQVTVDAARYARLERIEAAAEHYTGLHERQSRAMAGSASSSNASPLGNTPSRRTMLDAELAIRQAVRS